MASPTLLSGSQKERSPRKYLPWGSWAEMDGGGEHLRGLSPGPGGITSPTSTFTQGKSPCTGTEICFQTRYQRTGDGRWAPLPPLHKHLVLTAGSPSRAWLLPDCVDHASDPVARRGKLDTHRGRRPCDNGSKTAASQGTLRTAGKISEAGKKHSPLRTSE